RDHHLPAAQLWFRFQYHETLPCNCDKERLHTSHLMATIIHLIYFFPTAACCLQYLHHNKWKQKYCRTEFLLPVFFHPPAYFFLQKERDNSYEIHSIFFRHHLPILLYFRGIIFQE